MKSQPISACICKAKITNLGFRVRVGRSAPPAHTGLTHPRSLSVCLYICALVCLAPLIRPLIGQVKIGTLLQKGVHPPLASQRAKPTKKRPHITAYDPFFLCRILLSIKNGDASKKLKLNILRNGWVMVVSSLKKWNSQNLSKNFLANKKLQFFGQFSRYWPFFF